MSQRPRRASVSPDQLDELVGGAPLPAATQRYFTQVLRLDPGTVVELGDGSGRIVAGRLDRAGDSWILVDVERVEAVGHVLPIALYAGLLKPKRWRLVVEKCVELGVARLVPVLTARAQSPPERELARLADRWSRIALEAAKQCRRAQATAVSRPVTLASALAAEVAPNRLIADVAGAAGWPEGGLLRLAPTALLVGPEGGFTDAEREQAEQAHFQAISLGGFALRAETAAVALLALARDRLGFARREIEEGTCR